MSLWYENRRSFIVTQSGMWAEDLDGCIIRWPKMSVGAAPAKFVYVEVAASNANDLADALAKSAKSGVVATHEPGLLRELFQAECTSNFRLALRVTKTRDLEGLNRCPYDAVEISESMATHDLIWKIQHSSKEVYVRIPRASKAIQSRRLVVLMHEKVDILLLEDDKTLSLIRSLLRPAAPNAPEHEGAAN